MIKHPKPFSAAKEMTTPNPLTLETILKEFARYCSIQGTPFGTMPNDFVTLDKAIQAIAQLYQRDIQLEVLDGRFVELDLLEQAINQKRDIEVYKLIRLGDLLNRRKHILETRGEED